MIIRITKQKEKLRIFQWQKGEESPSQAKERNKSPFKEREIFILVSTARFLYNVGTTGQQTITQ